MGKGLEAVVIALTGVILLLAPPAMAYPLDIATEREVLTLHERPLQLAVFDLGVLDNLDTLGVEVAGLPKELLPDHLSDYGMQSYLSVGNLFEPDYTVLKTLKPDLIFTGERTKSAYEALSQLAPVIELDSRSDSLVEGLSKNLRLLGLIFDRQVVAEQKIKALELAVRSNQVRFSQQKGLVLFSFKGSLIPHAPGERFGMLYELLGMESVVQAARTPSGILPKVGSPEAKELHQKRLTEALAAQPDWLVILDRDAVKGAPSKIHEMLELDLAITSSPAWKNQQVFYLDSPSWYLATGGYQGVMKTLQTLLKLTGK